MSDAYEPFLTHDTGFDGCIANWKSCGTVSHQVYVASLKSFPKAWTYERILGTIKKSNQEHAYRMLQCLVAAVHPLRVEELAEVLAFDFNGISKLNPAWRWEEKEAVMSTYSSLVIVVKGNSEDSWIVHFSVKSF